MGPALGPQRRHDLEGRPRRRAADVRHSLRSACSHLLPTILLAARLTPPLRSDAMWYVRALPNVRKAFETAYGEPAVAAYDRPSVNLPTSSGNEASLRVAERSFEHGKLRR